MIHRATTDSCHSYLFVSFFFMSVCRSSSFLFFTFASQQFKRYFFLRLHSSFFLFLDLLFEYNQSHGLATDEVYGKRKNFCLFLPSLTLECHSRTIIRNGAIKNSAEDYRGRPSPSKVIWSRVGFFSFRNINGLNRMLMALLSQEERKARNEKSHSPFVEPAILS